MSNGNTPHQSGFGSGTDEQRRDFGATPGGQGFQGGQQAGMGASDSMDDGMGMGEGACGGMREGMSRMRGMASQAGEKLMDTAEQQKRAGADYVTGVAEAVRRAAGEFDEQVPQAAQYIRLAADQMETMSDSLRRRDMGQMLSDVQSFARRQPAAFLGISLLAGFAAMRFLRSTSDGGRPSNGGYRRHESDFDDDGRYGAGGSRASGIPGSGPMTSGPGM